MRSISQAITTPAKYSKNWIHTILGNPIFVRIIPDKTNAAAHRMM
ncbi:hypothetical protein AB395_00002803 [Sinorhizobium fredii CCBAU 45436]|nr:hypothetical protein AB395_00002803 [Sinorhizobium fredii CCBAU 45436]